LKVVRILLVDDSLAFRRFVREILERRRDFQVVGEASDGFEAVRQATQLKPDLILLDIGIPRLNGIAVARGIRQVVPDTKILFLTMNSDPDVVGAALDTEAKGYVWKMDAASELWLAIEAVLRGQQFLSSGVVGSWNGVHLTFTDSAESASVPLAATISLAVNSNSSAYMHFGSS